LQDAKKPLRDCTAAFFIPRSQKLRLLAAFGRRGHGFRRAFDRLGRRIGRAFNGFASRRCRSVNRRFRRGFYGRRFGGSSRSGRLFGASGENGEGGKSKKDAHRSFP